MRTTSKLGIFLLLFWSVGCGGGGDSSDNGPSGDDIRLRVVHASSNAGAVDITVTGTADAQIDDFDYGDTSPFVPVPAGDYTIEVRAAGADPASGPVFSADVTLPSDLGTVTVVAAGLVGEAPGSGREFRLLTLVHDFDTPAAGQTVVRVVHASPEADAVKIDVGDDGVSEIQVLARYDDTGAAGVPLPSGASLQVGIRDSVSDDRVTAFTTPELPEGAELFVIATGLPSERPADPEGFRLLAIGPDGTVGFLLQNPVVYALHAGVDAPAVRVFTGTTPLTEAIAFGELSGPIQVPPGSYPVSLNLASNDAVALTGQTPDLMPGDRWLAVARGFAGGQTNPLELDFRRESFQVDDTTAFVRALHASPDAPMVELGTVANQTFTPLGLPLLGYGEETDPAGIEVPLTAFVLGLRAAGAQDPAATFDLSAAAGNRVIAVAIGSLLDETKDPFGLGLIFTETTPWSYLLVDPNDS